MAIEEIFTNMEISVDHFLDIRTMIKRSIRLDTENELDGCPEPWRSETASAHIAGAMSRLREVFERSGGGDYKSISTALSDFRQGLRRAVEFARVRGNALYVETTFDMLSKLKDELSSMGWGAAEKSTLQDYILEPGDRIAAIEPRRIVLESGKAITRSQVNATCRVELLQNLVTEKRLAEIEAALGAPKFVSKSGTGIMTADGKFVEFA
jgi:hypothetical protein